MSTAVGKDARTDKWRFFADLSVNTKILTAITVAVLVALTVGITGLSALGGASGESAKVRPKGAVG